LGGFIDEPTRHFGADAPASKRRVNKQPLEKSTSRAGVWPLVWLEWHRVLAQSILTSKEWPCLAGRRGRHEEVFVRARFGCRACHAGPGIRDRHAAHGAGASSFAGHELGRLLFRRLARWRLAYALSVAVRPRGKHPPGGSSWVGGLHTGFNWQFGHLVVGTDTNYRFTDLQSSSACPNIFDDCHQRTRNIFTFGGRAGLEWNNWLLYGTGGYAGAQIETTVTSKADPQLHR
jgi:hypothetical protein